MSEAENSESRGAEKFWAPEASVTGPQDAQSNAAVVGQDDDGGREHVTATCPRCGIPTLHYLLCRKNFRKMQPRKYAPSSIRYVFF
jgi:hypothetical protein